MAWVYFVRRRSDNWWLREDGSWGPGWKRAQRFTEPEVRQKVLDLGGYKTAYSYRLSDTWLKEAEA